jgi:hypothetical protein
LLPQDVRFGGIQKPIVGVCNIDLRYVKQLAYIKADKLVTTESSALCASHRQLTDNLSAICGRDRIPWYKGYTPPKDMVIAQHNDLVKGKLAQSMPHQAYLDRNAVSGDLHYLVGFIVRTAVQDAKEQREKEEDEKERKKQEEARVKRGIMLKRMSRAEYVMTQGSVLRTN